MLKSVLTVVGARPQFVKAAVVSAAIRADGRLSERLLHTGQHYDDLMSDVFFREFGLPTPDVSLNVRSGPHGHQTAQMLIGVEQAITDLNPDVVLVYGDTNSTLAGALAAAKAQVPCAHVEAGLRSFNRSMPEEVNRVVADHVSSLLLAPTANALNNLLMEGIGPALCHVVGDVMYDAALAFAEYADTRSAVLDRYNLRPHEYVLATIHRAGNTDNLARLERIIQALQIVAEDIAVILPVHPRTRARLIDWIPICPPRLRLVDPVGYIDMQRLEKCAAVIATDSGGVQKEAFFIGCHRSLCGAKRSGSNWLSSVGAAWQMRRTLKLSRRRFWARLDPKASTVRRSAPVDRLPRS